MTFEVKGGCFGYDRQVLTDINFKVEDNSILSILGPNGVGKTTLVKCMLGLLKWSRGNTYIDGVEMSQIKHGDFWKKIGYVPQAKLSAFAYTVEEMVLLGRNAHLKMSQQPGEEDYAIAKESMEYVGIQHLKHKLCSKISGGELQMVLIARALTTQPSMLVLDEPESNLDFRNQLIVLNSIKELSKYKKIPSIVNTHYPEHAITISDNALVLSEEGYLHGMVEDVITEKGMKKAFGVNVKIAQVPIAGGDYTCVLPISIV